MGGTLFAWPDARLPGGWGAGVVSEMGGAALANLPGDACVVVRWTGRPSRAGLVGVSNGHARAPHGAVMANQTHAQRF